MVVITDTHIDTADFSAKNLQIAATALFVIPKPERIFHIVFKCFGIIHLMIQATVCATPIQFPQIGTAL